MKHIVLLSGGHQSALVAIEVFRKYQNANIVLLNHDINPEFEHRDIKRFKQEISIYLKTPITYCNFQDLHDSEIPNQFSIAIANKTFINPFGSRPAICTYYLKTNPFNNYLKLNYEKDDLIYYGFSKQELHRKVRRQKKLELQGYKSEYPLINWEKTISSTNEIGILPPYTYQNFKHANCIGCLKAGIQHWYVVFCLYPEIFQKAIITEEYIKHSIHSEGYLKDFIDKFQAMQFAGIPATEHIPSQRFWSLVKKSVPGTHFQQSMDLFPCECIT